MHGIWEGQPAAQDHSRHRKLHHLPAIQSHMTPQLLPLLRCMRCCKEVTFICHQRSTNAIRKQEWQHCSTPCRFMQYSKWNRNAPVNLSVRSAHRLPFRGAHDGLRAGDLLLGIAIGPRGQVFRGRIDRVCYVSSRCPRLARVAATWKHTRVHKGDCVL